MRPRDTSRFSVWTVVAPVALVLSVMIALNVVRDARRASDDGSGTVTAAQRSTTPTSTAAAAAPTGTTTAKRRPRYQRIRPGDTFEAIARRYGVPQSRLRRLNPSLDPATLQPGARIRIS